ncbi:TetR family transcriptional regulator [Prauserella marina]|uniref:Regulatory protein, tetR family n=1 Tax=Prauserella marina TaxID=530584 RepID=A0A222VJ09_9PSEU|nr:TetR/AcrR family transcriptional regulator [Prauserella marina]ASR33905.1 TetR family transcriptional regulator [Prauserella marina]PWV82502.1 TetR family transcriptional regulator [Prauserella marina]SDC70705.1 regulatory protein, tetR family [Prauserella marina]
MNTKEAILRAALRVIGEQGVAGLTNRRIVAEAGVSLGSLTYHFPSQTALLREAMLLFAADETARLGELARARKADELSVEDAAVAVGRVLEGLPMTIDEIASLELYLQGGRDPGLRDVTARCFAAYDELALTILRTLGVGEPERLVGPVVALIGGLQLRRLATGEAPATPAADALMMLVRGAGR